MRKPKVYFRFFARTTFYDLCIIAFSPRLCSCLLFRLYWNELDELWSEGQAFNLFEYSSQGRVTHGTDVLDFRSELQRERITKGNVEGCKVGGIHQHIANRRYLGSCCEYLVEPKTDWERAEEKKMAGAKDAQLEPPSLMLQWKSQKGFQSQIVLDARNASRTADRFVARLFARICDEYQGSDN